MNLWVHHVALKMACAIFRGDAGNRTRVYMGYHHSLHAKFLWYRHTCLRKEQKGTCENLRQRFRYTTQVSVYPTLDRGLTPPSRYRVSCDAMVIKPLGDDSCECWRAECRSNSGLHSGNKVCTCKVYIGGYEQIYILGMHMNDIKVHISNPVIPTKSSAAAFRVT